MSLSTSYSKVHLDSRKPVLHWNLLFCCSKIYKHYLNYATLHTAEMQKKFFLKLSTSHNTCSLLSLGLIRIAEIRQVSFLPILTVNTNETMDWIKRLKPLIKKQQSSPGIISLAGTKWHWTYSVPDNLICQKGVPQGTLSHTCLWPDCLQEIISAAQYSWERCSSQCHHSTV